MKSRYAALALIVGGIAGAVLAVILALSAAWMPRRNLDADPLVAPASEYVGTFRGTSGRLPTTTEFERWMGKQPSDLSYEGRGFAYEALLGIRCPTTPCRFRFSFWGGNNWIEWYPPEQEGELVEALCIFAASMLVLYWAYRLLPRTEA